jgi:hypothetical protein
MMKLQHGTVKVLGMRGFHRQLLQGREHNEELTVKARIVRWHELDAITSGIKLNQADHWHLPGMGVAKEFVYDKTRGLWLVKEGNEKRLLPSRVSASCIATATSRHRADTMFMRSAVTDEELWFDEPDSYTEAKHKYEPAVRLDCVPTLSKGMKVQVSSRHGECEHAKGGYCLGEVQKENQDGTFKISHGGNGAQTHAKVERHDISVEDGSDLGTAIATRIDAVFRNKIGHTLIGGSFVHRMHVNGKPCASWTLQEEQTGGRSSNSFWGMRAARTRSGSNDDTLAGRQEMKREKTPDDREQITFSFIFDEPTHVRTVHLRSAQPTDMDAGNGEIKVTIMESSRALTIASKAEAAENEVCGWESIQVHGRKDVSSRLCIACGDEDFKDSNTGQVWHKLGRYDCMRWGGYLNESAELTIAALSKSKELEGKVKMYDYREALSELKQKLKIENGEVMNQVTVSFDKICAGCTEKNHAHRPTGVHAPPKAGSTIYFQQEDGEKWAEGKVEKVDEDGKTIDVEVVDIWRGETGDKDRGLQQELRAILAHSQVRSLCTTFSYTYFVSLLCIYSLFLHHPLRSR